MQNDLISRSALIEEIESLTMQITGLRAGKGVLSECMKEYKKSILRIIDEQPTAYDVEVVVSKLEKEKGTVFIDGKPMYNEDDFIDIDKAIEIVRNGGKE